jgi:hypothetical protein
MSPRIIHIPLSGGDRKAQAKGIRYARGINETYFQESVLIRSTAELGRCGLHRSRNPGSGSDKEVRTQPGEPLLKCRIETPRQSGPR